MRVLPRGTLRDFSRQCVRGLGQVEMDCSIRLGDVMVRAKTLALLQKGGCQSPR